MPANGRKLSFEDWLRSVDRWVGQLLGGLSYLDLPDVNYADMYEDGLAPKSAARRAIRNANGMDE